jgi:hypothetical protein
VIRLAGGALVFSGMLVMLWNVLKKTVFTIGSALAPLLTEVAEGFTRVVVTVSKVVAISVANNAALHLAVAKAVSSPAAISAPTIGAATASKHATIATIATAVHPALQALQAAVTIPVVAQATALRPVAPKSSVLAISSPTMREVTQHLSALAPKC